MNPLPFPGLHLCTSNFQLGSYPLLFGCSIWWNFLSHRFHKIEGWGQWSKMACKRLKTHPLAWLNSWGVRLLIFRYSGRSNILTARRACWGRSSKDGVMVMDRGHGFFGKGLPVGFRHGNSGGWGRNRWCYRSTVWYSERRQRWRDRLVEKWKEIERGIGIHERQVWGWGTGLVGSECAWKGGRWWAWFLGRAGSVVCGSSCNLSWGGRLASLKANK